MLGAIGATENRAVLFDAVADYSAAAMGANRRQGIDRALERIKDVLVTVHRYRKSFVILVAAYITLGHRRSPCCRAAGRFRRFLL